MTRSYVRVALSLTLCAVGCGAAAPRPMRYVAVDMPQSVPVAASGGAARVEVSRTRVLPNIRLPEDAAEFFQDLHKKTGMSVLRNADLKLTTSVCVFLCVNTDSATADGSR